MAIPNSYSDGIRISLHSDIIPDIQISFRQVMTSHNRYSSNHLFELNVAVTLERLSRTQSNTKQGKLATRVGVKHSEFAKKLSRAHFGDQIWVVSTNGEEVPSIRYSSIFGIDIRIPFGIANYSVLAIPTHRSSKSFTAFMSDNILQ